jgi:hypothetical protein
VARRPLEREGVCLAGGRRTTQLMRDSLGGFGQGPTHGPNLSVTDPLTHQATFLERWIANPRTLLAYCLALGAATGAWFWVQYALNPNLPATITSVAMAIFGLLYFSIAGYAGVLLLRQAVNADRWAVAALLPQVLQIQTAALLYRVTCGPDVTISVGAGRLNFGLGASVGFTLLVQRLHLPAKFTINLVPVVFLWYFYHQARSRLTSA